MRALLRGNIRIVALANSAIPLSDVEVVKNDSKCNNVVDDLAAYTGFPPSKLNLYLSRDPKHNYDSEFNWYNPKDYSDLTWFYRCNAMYLFGNAIHPSVALLNDVTDGEVLDYGAGVGSNTIELAKRGCNVDFVEINRIQADFLRFRAVRNHLNNIKEILPYHEGKFDPILCVQKKYNVIVAMDVLEHIPDYHYVVERFIACLKPGGVIYENSPFDENADDIAIHVRPSVPLEVAMRGMMRVKPGVWQKP